MRTHIPKRSNIGDRFGPGALGNALKGITLIRLIARDQ
jgi:hypothetical protein